MYNMWRALGVFCRDRISCLGRRNGRDEGEEDEENDELNKYRRSKGNAYADAKRSKTQPSTLQML